MTEAEVRAWRDWLLEEGRRPRPFTSANAAPDDPLHLLSAREHQVMVLLANGARTKEIAALLELSPKTVDTYRASLMRKHDVPGLVNSESAYDYEPARNAVVERSVDGKRYIVGVQNAELERLEELKDEGKSELVPDLRELRSR